MQKKTIVLKIEKVKLISELYSWNKKIIVSLSREVISLRKKRRTFVLPNGDKANALGLEKRDLSMICQESRLFGHHKRVRQLLHDLVSERGSFSLGKSIFFTFSRI